MNTINLFKTIKTLLPIIPKNGKKITGNGSIEGLLFSTENNELELTATNGHVLVTVKFLFSQITNWPDIRNDKKFLIHKLNLQTVIDKIKNNSNLTVVSHKNQLYFIGSNDEYIITDNIKEEFPNYKEQIEKIKLSTASYVPTLCINNLLLVLKVIKDINNQKSNKVTYNNVEIEINGKKKPTYITSNNITCLIMPIYTG
jgi:hypothetical protein